MIITKFKNFVETDPPSVGFVLTITNEDDRDFMNELYDLPGARRAPPAAQDRAMTGRVLSVGLGTHLNAAKEHYTNILGMDGGEVLAAAIKHYDRDLLESVCVRSGLDVPTVLKSSFYVLMFEF